MLVVDATRPETYSESLQTIFKELSGNKHPLIEKGTNLESQRSLGECEKGHILFIINKMTW